MGEVTEAQLCEFDQAYTNARVVDILEKLWCRQHNHGRQWHERRDSKGVSSGWRAHFEL